jgi:DNA-binding transcriptional MocR family regulator
MACARASSPSIPFLSAFIMYLKKGTFGIFPAEMCKGIHPYTQVLFTWIYFHANKDGECFPSTKLLAEETGMSRRSIVNHLNKLEEKGYIKKTPRKKGGSNENTSNLYRVLVGYAGGAQPYAGGAQGVMQEVPSNQTHSNQTHLTSFSEEKKEKKKPITYQNQQAKPFSDLCQQRGIVNLVPEGKYLEMRKEFSARIDWWKNARDCIDWNYDNNNKKISSQRLRNWMKKAVEIQAQRDIQQKQKYMDEKLKKNQQVFIKSKLEPIWTPPV